MVTDQEINECLSKLNTIALDENMWDYGLPLYDSALEKMREPIRKLLAAHEAKAAPAVPVYQLAKLGGPTETAWIDVTQEVYEDAGFYKDDFKRRILYATPAPPATSLNRYRVWPDDTVQDYADGNPYNWMSDDYQLIDAETPEQALSISKGEVL